MGELKNRERMNITLSKDMAAKLRAHCDELGYNISTVIENCLEEYFRQPDGIKYEVLANTMTLPTEKENWTAAEIEAAYFDQFERDETSLGLFDNLDDARAWLEKCKKHVHSTIMQGTVGRILRADVAYIQEGVYTADGDFIQGGDIMAFCADPL